MKDKIKRGRDLDKITDDEAVSSILKIFVQKDDLNGMERDFQNDHLLDKAKEILKFLTMGTHNIKSIKSLKLSENRKSLSWSIITKNDIEEKYSTDLYKSS